MNIVFWLLVLLGMAALWSLLAFIFVPIGRLLLHIVENVIREMETETRSMEEKEHE